MIMNPHGFHCGNPTGVFPVTAFSAFHILRNYNYLLTPPPADFHRQFRLPRYPLDCPSQSPASEDLTCVDSDRTFLDPDPKPYFRIENPTDPGKIPYRNETLEASPYSQPYTRRQRGEKKPIPEEQKDEKYFERRRRNNQAAKKSRDARKIREDQIALRAAILEHENAILKAQVLTLREETTSLRQMLLQKKSSDLAPRN